MKKSFIVLLCAVLMSISAYAQSVSAAQVPSPVKKAFMTKFGSPSDVEWEKIGTTYSAQFMEGEDWTQASFSDKGVWLNTDTSLDPEDASSVIKKAITKAMPGYDILSLNKIESASGTNFLAQVSNDSNSFEVLMKADGSIIRKTKVEDEEESEEDDDNDY